MSNLDNPWINRNYSRDGKLRSLERYWRYFSPKEFIASSAGNGFSVDDTNLIIIPDSESWRRYLKLIRCMIQDIHKDGSQQQNTPVHFLLLESVVELMDYRNQAPCVFSSNNSTVSDNHKIRHDDENCAVKSREMAAPQERIILQRLVQDNANTVASVNIFCDLSFRDVVVDDWSLLAFPKMSISKRSQHALIRAARMISEAASNTRILLVNDSDTANEIPLDEKIDDKIHYTTINEFIQVIVNHYGISQKRMQSWKEAKRLCEEDYRTRNYPKLLASALTADEAEATVYLSEERIQEGLRNGGLLRGRLNVTKENPREAFVSISAGKTFFIDQHCGYFNKSFHQDIVIIQPLPEDQWGRPVGKRRLVFQHSSNKDDDDEKTNNDHLLDDSSVPSVPSARVVAIHQPSRRIIVATMLDTPLGDDSAVLVVPMDIRFPKVRIRTRDWRRFFNVRLKVEIDGWEQGSNYPHGHCVDILGPIGDLETEIESLLIENQVNLAPFSASALASLPVEGDRWHVTEKDMRNRRDLRTSRRVFSVDPPGCQDIDDSMHVEVLPNGDIEVGVHIADVTHFVPHNSSLDIESQARSTTFYLVDRRFDMLPSLLSSNICSLHGGTDRLAVSVIWTFSSDYREIKSCWYGRTAIHNCAAMTYDQADNILNDRAPEGFDKVEPPPLTAGAAVNPKLIRKLKHDLSILTKLARIKRSSREDIGGAVDLSSGDTGNELKFTLVHGKPTKVDVKEVKEIHHTIAELMILANTAVAKRIYDHFPDSSLLRIHRNVGEDRLDDLREVLEASGLSLHGKDNKALSKSLREAQRSNKSNVVKSLFNSIATRAMTEAQYICTGSGQDLLHYGLGLDRYTHFTSPIRRYADIVVHKQLLASLSIDNNLVHRYTLYRKKNSLESLKMLPRSSVVSILGGEGLSSTYDDSNDLVDILTHDASEITLASDMPQLVEEPLARTCTLQDDHASPLSVPYSMKEVSHICEQLNLHNRLAKQSSFECQTLFLSLYFRNHVENADAVVTQLRENGFWVYVPKFDIRGPVYIRDSNYDVQIDPVFLGLSSGSGLPATLGFSSDSSCRRFPDGKAVLFSGPTERLEVSVPYKNAETYVIRPLDVVTIRLTCVDWDVKARIPAPRFHLVPQGSSLGASSHNVQITSESREREETSPEMGNLMHVTEWKGVSMFVKLSAIPIHPVLDAPFRKDEDKKKRLQTRSRKENLQGRIVFGGFVNPDTRSFAQEESQRAAAADADARRANVVEAATRRNEFDMTRSIERTVTSRQQRLAADKRNARKSKAK